MGKISAVEITTFRLRGADFEQFVEANRADVDVWLKQQKGFVSRSIAHRPDKTIMDIVFWERVEDGTEAMNRILRETAESNVHGMIDQTTVYWDIFEVGHNI